MQNSGQGLSRDPSSFSIVLGGPLFQLLCRAHLSNDALTLLWRRIIVFAAIAWLPLLLFSTLDGDAVGHNVKIPFLFDVEAHMRFLVAMPLLIGAELTVHRRMLGVVRQFRERHMVPENAVAQFDRTVASAMRLRNSVLAELLLIGLVYGVGILIVWRHYIALDTATWYATSTAEGNALRLAGIWYGYVSLPIFQFLLLRWYFRLLVWARFLWQVARIPLNLIPMHPDHMAGLGFLSAMVQAIAVLAVPHGVMVAGMIANRIFYLGASLPTFVQEIVVIVLFVMIVIIGPLLVFAPQLARAKRVKNLEYGVLAERYVREFERKWLRGGAPADEPLVGSGDIQSLADLNGSLEIVREMRIVPVSNKAVLTIVILTLAPIAPLLLTMMPVEDLAKKLFSILL